jgi:hypothetical protein
MKNIQFGAVLLLLVLFSCTSSKITNSWKSSSIPYKKYNKILVIGINGGKDIGSKEKMETEFVSDLKNLGYNAISSVQEYGPKTFQNIDEDAVINKFQGTGFDAVITIVMLSKEKERYYVPAQVYFSPYAMYHRHFWGYYNTMYARIYTPGYYVIDKRYFWESNLYDLTTKELVYSVQTESYNPSSSASLAHEYGELIVNDMIKNNVLKKE